MSKKLTFVEGMDDLMKLEPDVLVADFKISAVGTLVTGQWFAKNADTSKVSDGEYPLFLVTGGLLHKVCSFGNARVRRQGKIADIGRIPCRTWLHSQPSSPLLKTSPPISLKSSQRSSTYKSVNP